jgi:hypothetical protein
MASTLTHFSIGSLAILFPAQFHLPTLLLASQFADFEYIKNIPKIFRKDGVHIAYKESETGPMHSILINVLIGVPVCIAFGHIFAQNSGYAVGLSQLFFSGLIGVLSHLMLDIPGHRELTLLWPYKVFRPNIFYLFKRPNKYLSFIYEIGKPADIASWTAHVATWNWMVYSHAFLLLAALPFVI